MPILLPTLAASFAAFCIWLTVRIVNRREKWAKWMLAAALVAMFLYPVSYVAWFKWGGAHWPKRPAWAQRAGRQFFWPLTESARVSPSFRLVMDWYMKPWTVSPIYWDYDPSLID